MSLTAREYTKLLEEIKKAKKATDYLLDFVDLMNNNKENISGDITTPGDKIKEVSHQIHKLIDQINSTIFENLNKIPVDQDEVKDAAEKFLLYQNREQILIWSEQQKANHPENSYWWKYWQAVYDYMKERQG